MAKPKANAEKTAEVKVEETAEVKVEETTEVKVEETTEVKVDDPVYLRQKLKNKHFQHPDDLCEFVNTNDIDIQSIVSYDRFQALYYYENK